MPQQVEHVQGGRPRTDDAPQVPAQRPAAQVVAAQPIVLVLPVVRIPVRIAQPAVVLAEVRGPVAGEV